MSNRNKWEICVICDKHKREEHEWHDFTGTNISCLCFTEDWCLNADRFFCVWMFSGSVSLLIGCLSLVISRWNQQGVCVVTLWMNVILRSIVQGCHMSVHLMTFTWTAFPAVHMRVTVITADVPHTFNTVTLSGEQVKQNYNNTFSLNRQTQTNMCHSQVHSHSLCLYSYCLTSFSHERHKCTSGKVWGNMN